MSGPRRSLRHRTRRANHSSKRLSTRRFTGRNLAISPTLEPVSARFSRRSTTKNPSIGARLPAPGRVRTQSAGSNQKGGRCATACLMSFLRHREIYHFDGVPAGYSWAGCSLALPASASPAGGHLARKAIGSTMEFHRTAKSVLTVCLSSGDHRRPWLADRDAEIAHSLQMKCTGHSAQSWSPCAARRTGYMARNLLHPYSTAGVPDRRTRRTLVPYLPYLDWRGYFLIHP